MTRDLYKPATWLMWLALPMTGLSYWQTWDRLPRRIAGQSAQGVDAPAGADRAGPQAGYGFLGSAGDLLREPRSGLVRQPFAYRVQFDRAAGPFRVGGSDSFGDE